MKWTAVVLMCSIVHLASVNCQCDLGDKVDYDPKMIEGPHYMVYCSANIFKELDNVQIKLTLEDGAYLSTRTLTFKNETAPRVFNSTWKIKSDKDIIVDTPELLNRSEICSIRQRVTGAVTTNTPAMIQRCWTEINYRLNVCRATNGANMETFYAKFNAVFRLLSKGNPAILIFKSCPPAFNGKPLIFVATTEKCPKEETVQHALADVGLDITNFSKDEAVDCRN